MIEYEWHELIYNRPDLNNSVPTIGSVVELENRPSIQYYLSSSMSQDNMAYIVWAIKTFGVRWREGNFDDPNPVWHGINEEPVIPTSGSKTIALQLREKQTINVTQNIIRYDTGLTILDVIRNGMYSKRWRYVSQPSNPQVANINFKYDMSPVVLWQYDNAPKLKKLVGYQQTFLDTAITQWQQEFNEKIFDLRTCDANGLELWGRLLKVQRPVIAGVQFTDEQYRLLLQSRIFVLTFNGSAYDLTTLIHKLFPQAVFTVIDNGDMTVSIKIAGGVTEEQSAVFNLGYVDPITGEFVHTFLPRPAGVRYNIDFNFDWSTVLGFEGMTETTNMGGTYDNDPDDHEGTTGIENPDGGVFYK